MKVLDRYIGLHVVVGTALALAIVLSIFTFTAFVEDLGTVGQGEYTYRHAVQNALLTTPLRAFHLFPIAAVVGSLLGLGVLAANRELTAARTAGVSLARIAAAVMKSALALAILLVVIGEVVVPRTEAIAHERRTSAISEHWTSDTADGFWARDGNSFIRIQEVLSGDRLRDVRIYEFDAEGDLRVAMIANSALYDDGEWRLQGVRQSTFGETGISRRVTARAVWRSGFRPDLIDGVHAAPAGLSAVELAHYIGYMRANGLSSARFELALAKKIVYPVASAVMIYLSLPLVLGRLGAGGVAPRVVVGSVLGVGFHILNEASGNVGIVYGVNPLLSAIAPTAAYLALGIVMMRRIN